MKGEWIKMAFTNEILAWVSPRRAVICRTRTSFLPFDVTTLRTLLSLRAFGLLISFWRFFPIFLIDLFIMFVFGLIWPNLEIDVKAEWPKQKNKIGRKPWRKSFFYFCWRDFSCFLLSLKKKLKYLKTKCRLNLKA